jgi:DNA-binding Xre family transcriptional regulator
MVQVNFEALDLQRRIRNMTKRELAKKLGKPLVQAPALIEFMKSGKMLAKHLTLIDRLCAALNVKRQDVIRW